MEIKEAVFVITGGSRGLGKSLATACIQAGARVVIASSNAQELKQTAEAIGATPVVCDVRKEVDVQNLAQTVILQYGKVDVWINNAGVWLAHAPIEEANWDRVHDMFEVNVFGTMYGTKAALLQMRKQGSGAIVNILSKSALDVRPGSSNYGASKCAAMGFTKGLMKEVEGSGVTAFAVYPGSMQTNLFDEQKPEKYAQCLTADFVAERIVQNMLLSEPSPELVIKRPGE